MYIQNNVLQTTAVTQATNITLYIIVSDSSVIKLLFISVRTNWNNYINIIIRAAKRILETEKYIIYLTKYYCSIRYNYFTDT